LDDSSDRSVPHYEINWYLPDPKLNDKYIFKGGFNQNTIVIQVSSPSFIESKQYKPLWFVADRAKRLKKLECEFLKHL
jgi:hypothetical protein